MEFFLMMFLTFIFSFSRADWTMQEPIYSIIGDTFYLHYKAENYVSSCYFYNPDIGDNEPFNVTSGSTGKLPDKRPPGWMWSSYGMDNKRVCGIQINSAAINDSGLWKVVIHTDTDSFPENPDIWVNILAPKAPDRVLLEPDYFPATTILSETDFKPMKFICTAYKTRGNVTLKWWIGDNLISINVTKNTITNNTSEDTKLLYKDVSQEFQYVPVSSHDSKQLKCNASHSEYNKDDLKNENNTATIDIEILAPPVPQEDIVFENHDLGDQSIEIKFHANPNPRNIYWEMHDMHHPIGEKETLGRYASLGFKPAENGDYIATIHITNLSESDGARDLQNKLWVQNRIDKTSYTFTFDFEDKVKVAGLSVGAIVGIVLGCLGAVCLIWLVVSQLRKKRKSKKITQEEIAETRDEMRETSRTQRT